MGVAASLGTRIVLAFLVLFLQVQHGLGQRHLAHAASIYSGLHGAAINPAQLSFNQSKWGLHLPGTGAVFQNNNLVVDRFGLINLAFGRTYSFEVDNALTRLQAVEAEVFLRADFERPSAIRLQNWVNGLGGFVQYKQHAFGLSGGARSFLELSAISPLLTQQLFEGLRYDSLLNVPIQSDGLRLNLMAFSELNFNWSYRFLERMTKSAAFGVAVRWMQSQQSAHLQLDQFSHTVEEFTDTFRVNQMVGQYARSAGNAGLSNGNGLAFDLGFTYVKVDPNATVKSRRLQAINCFDFIGGKRSMTLPAPAHYWKLGVSLLDLGWIRVQDVNFALSGSGIPYGLREQFFDFSRADFDASFVGRVDSFGNVIQSRSYTVGAATAFGMQFDYQLIPSVYFNASVVQRLPLFGDFQLGRLNQLVLAPRFENAWFSVGMPFSMLEYRHVQLGLMARIGPLSFGTDRLGELFGMQRIRGLDAYVSVDLFRFWR